MSSDDDLSPLLAVDLRLGVAPAGATLLGGDWEDPALWTNDRNVGETSLVLGVGSAFGIAINHPPAAAAPRGPLRTYTLTMDIWADFDKWQPTPVATLAALSAIGRARPPRVQASEPDATNSPYTMMLPTRMKTTATAALDTANALPPTPLLPFRARTEGTAQRSPRVGGVDGSSSEAHLLHNALLLRPSGELCMSASIGHPLGMRLPKGNRVLSRRWHRVVFTAGPSDGSATTSLLSVYVDGNLVSSTRAPTRSAEQWELNASEPLVLCCAPGPMRLRYVELLPQCLDASGVAQRTSINW